MAMRRGLTHVSTDPTSVIRPDDEDYSHPSNHWTVTRPGRVWNASSAVRVLTSYATRSGIFDVLDVKCYVLEDPYIDRDYSADYAQFYALTFHAHERHCKRVHFFSRDISPLLQRPLSTARLTDLSDLAKDTYCGFSASSDPCRPPRSAERFFWPASATVSTWRPP